MMITSGDWALKRRLLWQTFKKKSVIAMRGGQESPKAAIARHKNKHYAF